MSTTVDVRLDDEQSAAVSCRAAATLVTASAGSGKTEVVAQRVERILSADPHSNVRILSLSYTVKAAEELRLRFERRLGDAARRVDTDTVHGFAHGLLRKSGTWIGLPEEPEILSRDEDRVELLARWLAEEGERSDADVLRERLHILDLIRARCDTDPSGLLSVWEAAMKASGALDYPAMISRATELVRLPAARRQLSRMYEHVIVDEAQNLTCAQYRLLTALFGPPPLTDMTVMFVGDDKQSIVGFAGGDPRLMSQFADDYAASRFVLARNYRSARRIVELAGAIAGQLGHDGPPAEVTYAAEGSITSHVAPSEEAEGDFVSGWVTGLLSDGLPIASLVPGEPQQVRPEHIAILGRSAAALRATRLALEDRGLSPAMAVSVDDWLTTKAGEVALNLVAVASANHASPRWRLSRVLGEDEHHLGTLADVGRRLESRTDALRHLASLCSADTPAAFAAALSDVAIENDPNWEGDRLQLVDAWDRFTRDHDSAARTWGNFQVFLNRIQRSQDLTPGVRLLTVHKAQGREYRAVAVVGLNDGQFPDFRAKTDSEREAELRAFYVAVSRPTRVLLLSRAENRMTRSGIWRTDQSPFMRMALDYTD